jgi:hypothetical protein
MSTVRLQQAFISFITKIAKESEPNPVKDLAEVTRMASELLSDALRPFGQVIGNKMHKTRDRGAIFKACVGFIVKNKDKKKKDTFCNVHIYCIPERGKGDILDRCILEVHMSYPKTENKLARALQTGWPKSGIPVPQGAEEAVFSESLQDCTDDDGLDPTVFRNLAKKILEEAKKVQKFVPPPVKEEKLKMTQSELNEAVEQEILNMV